MARFDIHPMPREGRAGFLLDVQANLLQDLSTRVVIPLLPVALAPQGAGDLNPTFDIQGRPYRMMTQFLASVPLRDLGKPVLSLIARSDDISRALDLLLIGF
ncbi:CcdB family protein [Acidisoma cellulosilytica]|uniref:Toxin CcdB n=1 Tax=Acidisoma cellulosilyticum TaxID=2802395 RepID=A0A963Z7T5_9PROT|nr:CcdB family protein [Acidisoma cellulosilyticum]MCB8883452.1 CcdB family protein [Acidisoma cellulosilyticum]